MDNESDWIASNPIPARIARFVGDAIILAICAGMAVGIVYLLMWLVVLAKIFL